MMVFSPPQPKRQVVDREAAHYDGDADNLYKVVRHSGAPQKKELKRIDILLP